MSQATYGSLAPTAVPMSRRVLAWLAVSAVAAGAVVGSNAGAIRDRLLGTALPAAAAPATSRVAGQAPSGVERTTLRSAPWWQAVTTLEGAGSATSVPFTIDRRAIQWRVTGSCAAGHLLVRAPGQPQPLVDAPCPEQVGHGRRRGSTSLEVSADGPWRLEIEQRIDFPLVEPRAPAMTAPGTTTVASGSFHKVDKVGAGDVTIYRPADGGYSVRLDDFWVSPRSSLQLRLSAVESPQTSADYLSAPSQLLAALDVTAGSMNYTAPVGVDPAGFRSVVIWSPSDNSVYAAAPLESHS